MNFMKINDSSDEIVIIIKPHIKQYSCNQTSELPDMLKIIILSGNCACGHAKLNMHASVSICHCPLSANGKAAKVYKHCVILHSRKSYLVDVSSVAYN